MKSYLLALFLFLSISFRSEAQTNVYHPFPDSAQWNVRQKVFCLNLGIELRLTSYLLQGDTTFQSTDYKKLYITGELDTGYSLCHPWPTQLIPGYFVGGIRQDTSARKVFIYDTFTQQEKLLFDFTLQVGDTTRGYTITSWSTDIDTVVSIDSILIGSSYRKRWLVNPIYSIYWIEGVGSSYGFIQPSPGNFIDGDDWTIECFKVNDTTLYTGNDPWCDLISGIKTTNHQIPRLNINQQGKSIQITSTEEQPFNRYSVFTTSGTLQYAGTINSSTLLLDHLVPGMYILRAELRDGSDVKQRFVVY